MESGPVLSFSTFEHVNIDPIRVTTALDLCYGLEAGMKLNNIFSFGLYLGSTSVSLKYRVSGSPVLPGHWLYTYKIGGVFMGQIRPTFTLLRQDQHRLSMSLNFGILSIYDGDRDASFNQEVASRNAGNDAVLTFDEVPRRFGQSNFHIGSLIGYERMISSSLSFHLVVGHQIGFRKVIHSRLLDGVYKTTGGTIGVQSVIFTAGDRLFAVVRGRYYLGRSK